MLPLPPLYPITDASRPESLAQQIRNLGEAGFPLVQFRGKGLDLGRQWAELRTALRASAEGGGWPLIVVNDRADLAVLAASEGLTPWGLHLGQSDLPPAEARRLPGLERVHLGTSTHHPGEWEAVDAACDHAGVGPLRATPSKADHAQPIGLEGLQQACGALRAQDLAPVAIGGIGAEDMATCFEVGVASLAMIGAVARAASPGDLLWEAQRLRWQVQAPVRPGAGVVLVGGSGSGKSALARALEPRLGLPAREVDQRVAREVGCTVAEVFRRQGEGAFRDLETSAALELLGQGPCILDLGAGAWESEALRSEVHRAGWSVLWVAERPEVAWARVAQDPERPLAASQKAFLARWRERMEAWSVCNPVLPLGRTPETLAKALAGAV